ncbi:UDP-N-acetylmuramoyl-tripeptide--D-alanyl-D-alanine ligase [Candidatus Collierbacteria bacterium]|nr:UDP-N-acetylmuramoyl-tripeptide--D-alanyl-D-alanine ligase [Candidatus Collierbacteria bacterium]
MKNILRWPVLWWLRFWARQVLKINRPFIVGVTGSAGKSSAVDAIAPVLRLKFKNLKVAEKANSESGIPADILGLHFIDYSFFDWLKICLLAPLKALHSVFSIQHSAFDCYLVEMGIDEPTLPKNMEYLLTILHPDIGVILNALPVHTQQFGSVATIAKEKGKLVTQNPDLQYAILNADQPEIISLKPVDEARIVTFGRKKNADVVIKSILPSLDGTSISLFINHKSYFINLLNLALPNYYSETMAVAATVGMILDLPVKKISEALTANFNLPPGRGRIFQGIKNTTIIDSSYNASGKTMNGSLEMLKNIGGGKIKIAVLGDMRELGSQAEIEHKKVAETAIKSADKIILVGPLMKQYFLPAIQQSKLPVEWFSAAGEAANYLTKNLSGNEIILVKGSQNTIFLEIMVEALLKNKSDVENLCRRGKFWDKKRKPFI